MEIGFAPFTRVIVCQVSDTDWEVQEDIHYQASEREFMVPKGSLTDFASTPRITSWAFPSYGRYTACAILHDRLWRHYIPQGELGYREADGILRQAMRLEDVPFVTRWVMWAAVRWGALTRFGDEPQDEHGSRAWTGAKDWWRDVHLILIWSVLALLFVAVPAVAISIFLVLWWIVELIAYVPLKLFSKNKRVVKPVPTTST